MICVHFPSFIKTITDIGYYQLSYQDYNLKRVSMDTLYFKIIKDVMRRWTENVLKLICCYVEYYIVKYKENLKRCSIPDYYVRSNIYTYQVLLL